MDYLDYEGLLRYDELIKKDIAKKVAGPASSVDAHVATFDGTSGKAVKDSGFTIGKSVPSDAKFTDTTYSNATTSVSGLMSATDKSKLDGIASGATANTGTITGIKMNGSSVGTSGVVDLGTVITSHQDISGKVNTSTTVNGHALTGNVTVTKSDVGLSNVTNDAQVKRTEMGAANGVATLGSDSLISSSQLPSYVDDIVEGYYNNSKFYTTLSSGTYSGEITPEVGKIYVDKSTSKTYRWSSSAYVQIKGDIVIGTAQGNAADGKVVNDHINNTNNPHSVTASLIGLGNVGNFKAVSTGASLGLTTTEQSNARSNLGLGSAALKDAPSSGNASSTQVVLGNDSRLSNARAANGGNADTIDGYHILVVTSMPSSPAADTIYIVK